MNEVPVLLTVFNRVDLTQIMLDALRKMRPPLLYIAADGPRHGVESDINMCAQVRKDLESIDWPCQVVRLFQNQNLGCDLNVSMAISEVLEAHDRIVVLEDDCVPVPSFLLFCAEMLERYKNDTRVSMVCGCLPTDFPSKPYSYFFSQSYNGWGWATWRRAWVKFDYNMRSWPLMRASGMLRSRFMNEAEYRIWSLKYQRAYDNPRRPWDAAWGYACRKEATLAIFSHRSLISNTGVGHELATHRGNKDFSSIWARGTDDIELPLRHPPYVLPDVDKERAVKCTVAGTQQTLQRLRSRIKAVPVLLRDIGNLAKDYYDTF